MPRREIIPQLVLLRRDADVPALLVVLGFHSCVKCFILCGKTSFFFHPARILRDVGAIRIGVPALFDSDLGHK